MKKRPLSLLLALIMLISIISTMSITAFAADNPYPTWQTVGGVGTIPCTCYAWQQASHSFSSTKRNPTNNGLS